MSKRKTKQKQNKTPKNLPFLVRRKNGPEGELLLVVDHRYPDVTACLNAIARIEFRALTDVWIVFPDGMGEASDLEIEVLVDPLCVYLQDKAREWRLSLGRLGAGIKVADLRRRVRRRMKAGTKLICASEVPQHVLAFEPTGISKDRAGFKSH